MKSNPTKLSDGTRKLINQIENKEVRDQLLLGLHPSEVIEGWYFALASGILRIQGEPVRRRLKNGSYRR